MANFRSPKLLRYAKDAPRCMSCGRHNNGDVVMALARLAHKGVLNQKADVRYDSAKREKIRNVYFRASLANNPLVPVARPVVGGRVVRGRACWG